MRKRIRTPDGSTSLAEELSRRGFLAGAGTLGAAGIALGAAGYTQANAVREAPQAGTPGGPAGSYESVALQRDVLRIALMQMPARAVDAASPGRGRRENLARMQRQIEAAQEAGAPHDLLLFHEFPITGFRLEWSRPDVNRIAIDVPGPETEALGALASKYRCYIVFGSYANDVDWPRHVISMNIILGPDGTIVARHWKARNIMGAFRSGAQPVELMTTTVYNVLDRYVEMYGADAVVPVARTPIGNLCATSVQREPELFRAMAMKGGEILLRSASGGFSAADVEMCAACNRVYTAICNNSMEPGEASFDGAGGGGSAVYDDSGRMIASASGAAQQLVPASVPIRAYRDRHRIPDLAWALYAPVYGQYVPRFPPARFTRHLPADLAEAGAWLHDPHNTNW